MRRARSLAGRISGRLARDLLGTLTEIRTAEPVAALTFDDGPDPAFTPCLLDVLAARGAKATFFLVGCQAARHPDIVARIHNEGHAIGNHSWDHPSLPTLSRREIAIQLALTRAALGRSAGWLVRPPYGDQSLTSYLSLRLHGYRVVAWSIAAADWSDEDGETIATRVLNSLRPGSIVLLHDSLFSYGDEAYRDRSPTIEAVERILAARRDYAFLTLPELLARGRPIRRHWMQPPDPAFLARLRIATPDQV